MLNSTEYQILKGKYVKIYSSQTLNIFNRFAVFFRLDSLVFLDANPDLAFPALATNRDFEKKSETGMIWK
jgi:hypothetical protein